MRTEHFTDGRRYVKGGATNSFGGRGANMMGGSSLTAGREPLMHLRSVPSIPMRTNGGHQKTGPHSRGHRLLPREPQFRLTFDIVFEQAPRRFLPARTRSCGAIGVSESWFYKWRDRPATPAQQRRAALDAKVKEVFDDSTPAPTGHRECTLSCGISVGG